MRRSREEEQWYQEDEFYDQAYPQLFNAQTLPSEKSHQIHLSNKRRDETVEEDRTPPAMSLRDELNKPTPTPQEVLTELRHQANTQLLGSSEPDVFGRRSATPAQVARAIYQQQSPRERRDRS